MHQLTSALPPTFVLAREAYGDEGPQWVVAQAEAEILLRYGVLDDGEVGLTAAMFDPPNGAFVVARRGRAAGPPLGGVGLRSIRPGLGQIRRLWVDPAARGCGVARALIDGIEDAARDLGLTDLHLGTGDRQPEAVALYESTGWQRVRIGDDGRPIPPRHVWFTKQLLRAQ